MTILDQPFELDEPKPAKKKWTWFEMITAGAVVIMISVRESSGILWTWEYTMSIMTFLAASYLFANYWIDKPTISNTRTVLITILYGISYATCTFAFMFQILIVMGAKEMVYVAISVVGITILLDLLTSLNKTRVLSKYPLIRYGVFAIVIGTLWFIPESSHVESVYRRYPKFVSYYEEHKDEGEFLDVYYTYVEKYGPLDDE